MKQFYLYNISSFAHTCRSIRRIGIAVIFAACLTTTVAPVAAQQRKPATKKTTDKAWYTKGPDLHFVSMWGGVGYSGLVGNYTDLVGSDGQPGFSGGRLNGDFSQKFIGGGGGLFGVGYELHHHDFLFKVGPEFRFFSSRNNINLSTHVQRDDYASITQHYVFSDFHETQTVGQIMLPILFGGNFDRYYFLAGAKIGYAFMGNYRQKGTLTTSVTETAAVEDWVDAFNVGLETNDVNTHCLYKDGVTGKNTWKLDVALSAEFGVNLNEFFSDEWNKRNEASAHPWRMRVGAFIDYGMPILSSANKGNSYIADIASLNLLSGNHEPGYFTTSSLHGSSFANKKLSSLLVGVKFTALLQLNKIKQPNPRIVFVAQDIDRLPLKSIAAVTIKDVNKPKQKPKTRSLGKKNTVTARYAKSTYYMTAKAAGYMPSDFAGDTTWLVHTEDLDTVHFYLVPEPRLVCFVHDKENQKTISANIAFASRTNEAHNKAIQTTELIPGRVSLHYGESFDVFVTADGYHSDTAFVSDLTDTVHYYLKPIHRVRHKLLLKHMYFAIDQTEILSSSDGDLMILYNFLAENPKVRVRIVGHTDSDGEEDHNQILSEGRAESVKEAMVQRGINPDRIETEGKGESEPIDTNLTEEGKQNNRRVEVIVLNADDAEEDIF